MSNNPFQEPLSSWLLARMFFDTPYAAGLLKATPPAFSDPRRVVFVGMIVLNINSLSTSSGTAWRQSFFLCSPNPLIY